MRNRMAPRTRSEEGQWQINNTVIAFGVAVVLAILIGGAGHLFAIAQS